MSNYWISLLILLVVSSVSTSSYSKGFKESLASPDGLEKIIWTCKDNNNCKIYVLDKNRKKKWIIKDWIRQPIVTWHSNSLAEIHMSCGSPCWYSIFYDRLKGVSTSYPYVLAVNADKKIIAIGEQPRIALYQLYSHELSPFLYILLSDISNNGLALLSAIDEIKFTESGDLFIQYTAGEDMDVSRKKILKIIYP